MPHIPAARQLERTFCYWPTWHHLKTPGKAAALPQTPVADSFRLPSAKHQDAFVFRKASEGSGRWWRLIAWLVRPGLKSHVLASIQRAAGQQPPSWLADQSGPEPPHQGSLWYRKHPLCPKEQWMDHSRKPALPKRKTGTKSLARLS